MADRDEYRGYGSPSGRYYENREYDRGGRGDDRGGGDWRGSRGGGRDNDRGFFEKAGDEIRSWFGDDDDRSRNRDQHHDSDRHRDRGQRWSGMMSGDGGRDRDYRDEQRQTWGGGDRGGQSDWRGSSGGYEARGSRYGATEGGRYQDRGGYGAGQAGMGSGDYGRRAQGSQPHDDHYSEWRQQQIEALDRDYDEYRRENRDRFHSEFSNWRGQRQQQRSSMRQVREHMEVCGSDGEHLGTVDKVAGDRIILTKSDPGAGGHHHSIPCSWIQSVEDKVTVNKTAADARQQWQDEENRRALFEKDDQRQGDGPHVLNRSFSGTYENR